jgi:hypothetical protein
MDGSRDGVRRRTRTPDRDRPRGTLTRVSRGVWFWLGWLCLFGAVLGIVDDQITPGLQFLLIGAAILAFHRNAERLRRAHL